MLGNNQKRIIIYLLLFINVNTLVFCQEVNIKSSVNKKNIVIGDEIKLTLLATYNPLQYHVVFPNIADTFNHFELIKKNNIDTLSGRESYKYSLELLITNFDSGSWAIPPFTFKITPLNGQQSFTKLSDSIKINVNTISIDTSKPFKPIFKIRNASMPLQHIIIYILLGLLFLALIIFLIVFLRKKYLSKKKKIIIPEIKIPHHEKAMRALNELENKKLWQQGEEKKYYTELTDIVQQYLEDQFQITCFEKTSQEIIVQLKNNKPLSSSKQSLKDLFEIADMVKFAKNKPTEEQHVISIQIAKDIIIESHKKFKENEIANTK